jgi:serine/threonine protein kinase
LAPSLCENGKFNKFFANKKKIGEGAFGTVFSATNILEGKQYAVKKLFIKR